ncbi:hypothetical protein OAD75_06120 [Gammaproteobacteria bacterium]|nr:hypothetical protein [Gammaproteobacteria bacterium]
MNLKYISYGFLSISAISVIAYLVRQKKLLSSFGYEILSFTYLGTKNNMAKVEVKMRFTNTSDFNIKIKGYKFDVLLDGKVIAKAEDNLVYNIPAKQSVIIPFIGNADANLSLTLGISSLIENFIDSTQSTATLKGTINIQAGLVSIKNYPIEVSATTQELLNKLKSK